ncbi:DUF6318 family protein [Terrabacter sp. NPDC080008]|uniref:DUF6318 family protein n=1 Tax=Terrabacter sp. NPDC080008 TaxID=3155176 RepID=UPI00344BDA7A
MDPVTAKIPKAARAHTQEGAEAFARYFIDSLNRGATTPDAKALTGLFAPSCKTCAAMNDSLRKLESQGQRHAGPSLVVTRTSSLGTSASSSQVLIDVQQKAVAVVNTQGATLRKTASGPGTFVMTMSIQSGHWVATKLQTT